jgi:hypothetical protein
MTMTVIELLDDIVKIGFGWFGGWLIAKATRAHEFEKERRRRKQDCLEHVVEDLDESLSAIDDLAAISHTVAEVAKDPNKTLYTKALGEANTKIDSSNAALTKFRRWQSKLIVFGFERCAEATDQYHTATLAYHVGLGSVRQGNQEKQSERQAVLQSANEVRAKIAQAFKTL